MIASIVRHKPQRVATILSILALPAFGCATSGASPADPDKAVDKIKTATPIKHVIIVVGENRSFDHLFATYVPRNRGETVKNLLSEKIINADGTPGKHFRSADNKRSFRLPVAGRISSALI